VKPNKDISNSLRYTPLKLDTKDKVLTTERSINKDSDTKALKSRHDSTGKISTITLEKMITPLPLVRHEISAETLVS
jgi:hypothetical protein